MTAVRLNHTPLARPAVAGHWALFWDLFDVHAFKLAPGEVGGRAFGCLADDV
jgi:hypothetical protein